MVNEKGEQMLIPRRWFEAAVLAARIPNFAWRCLRHTFASRLVMLGMDLRTVKDLVGHKDIRMTRRRAHLAPARKLAAIKKLDGWGAEAVSPTGTKTSADRQSIWRAKARIVG